MGMIPEIAQVSKISVADALSDLVSRVHCLVLAQSLLSSIDVDVVSFFLRFPYVCRDS
jgi:hypothetical protein